MKNIIDLLLGTGSFDSPYIPDTNVAFDDTNVQGAQLDIILIDQSGSMSMNDYKPSRLGGAKEATHSFINEMRSSGADSLAGILTFGSTGNVICPPVSVISGHGQLNSAITNLRTDGSTNTQAGLQLAQATVGQCPHAINPRVLMLTDGYSDQSPVEAAESLKFCGVQLDIIGIGGTPAQVNEGELKEMASVVHGEVRYWFIKSVPELVQKFQSLALRRVR